MVGKWFPSGIFCFQLCNPSGFDHITLHWNVTQAMEPWKYRQQDLERVVTKQETGDKVGLFQATIRGVVKINEVGAFAPTKIPRVH